ncbi:protein crossbronx [Cladorrhinum sp. PSN332]|nr:protein crossbronx [Cladorrhinum sp. PSN332]
MSSSSSTVAKMPALPALKRQRLLAEFAALKQASPPGVFVSLTPGDPSLWSGIIFVRHGPYASAILRFQISFPDAYPALPPLVTFATDMFHPLITPLTTYMYTTDVQEGGTVSATDDERLPPGGFSLRHGFPGWFGRGKRRERDRENREREGTPPPLPPRRGSAATGSGSGVMTPPLPPRSIQEVAGVGGGGGTVVAAVGGTPGSVASTAATATTGTGMTGFKRTRREVSTYEVLGYIRSTFDDADVLDSVPLEAAGNPGAWHAWRAHRRALERKAAASPPPQAGSEAGGWSASVSAVTSPSVSAERLLPATPRVATPTARRPEEWNWEGVWQERVKRGIATSLSEAVLFGGAGMADDVINFLNMDEAEVEETKQNLLRTLGAVA